MKFNLILQSDSYKLSHFLQYPPETRYVSAYIEARDDRVFSSSLFFGLQAFLKQTLLCPITKADIEEAQDIAQQHGLPFHQTGWELLLNRHGGFLPLSIEALPEGTLAPIRTCLLQVTNTDPDFFWLTTYIETLLLRAVWYPSTVATISYGIRQIIWRYLETTCDQPHSEIDFKLHDFGARGVSSNESAALGGLAHLVNFKGTDTLSALRLARQCYHEPMAGFSIPAAEHSTITAWGRDGELQAYTNMLTQFGQKGRLLAVVSDSYDLYHAVHHLWGEQLRDQVKASGATVVIRPDSGDPCVVVLRVVQDLADAFGYTINQKGYKVLAPCVRVIQGDGVNAKTIELILESLMKQGFSAENVAFGMGGALLQHLNRDTLGFAMKANAIQTTDGIWRGIRKQPITDPHKASRMGRLAVIQKTDQTLQTVATSDVSGEKDTNWLREVYRNGALLIDESLATIRQRVITSTHVLAP